MTTDSADDRITIQLSHDMGLILFELLSRWSWPGEDKPTPDPVCFESPIETLCLKQVLAALESQFSEPFRSDYLELLAAARQRQLQEWVGWNEISLRRPLSDGQT